MMERGDADLVISIPQFLNEEHPKLPLYEDEHAVIAWSGGRYGKCLDRQGFYEADHAVVLFGGDRHPAFSETFFERQGIDRKVRLRVPTFGALPAAVIGTDRIATMYSRHAAWFAQLMSITVHQPPIEMPTVREELQWHKLRGDDPGLRWLIGLIQECASDMTEKPGHLAASVG